MKRGARVWSLARTLFGRIFDTVIVLAITSILVFALVRAIPGDPAVVMAGPDASPTQLASLRAEMGLDRPLPAQYAVWVGDVLRGDFGDSLAARRPVIDVIKRRLPATLEIAAGGFIATLVFGFSVGILAGLYRGKKVEWLASALNIGSLSVPTFWSGLVLLLVFGVKLGWFPLGGRTPFFEDPVAGALGLVLPSITLGMTLGPELAWYVRNGILETRDKDYIRTAYAKGIDRSRLVIHHLLRNALIPVITILGVQAGRLLSSAVVVEAVFSWPGLGTLGVQSILNRDYPAVQAVLLLFVVIKVGTNLVADLTYSAVDPRVRS